DYYCCSHTTSYTWVF
nr:immunoglobulin light chain junction region [Macaca mulatta]